MQAMQYISTFYSMIDQIFLNPMGLLAALAIVPLLTFYLMKPKPEEQVMPSIMFFQEEKEQDKLRKAYRTLVSNLPLLLQILAVFFFAFALAEPFTNTQVTSNKKVIVLDHSASVSADYKNLKNTLRSKAGEKNTLITASDSIKVRLEEASKSQLKSQLEVISPSATETDIVSAIEVAKRYEGDLLLVSDLDQTVDSREIQPVLDEMTKRNIETINPKVNNKWGIVGLEPSSNSTAVEIYNFEQTTSRLEVEYNQKSKEVVIEPESTSQIRFQSGTGENTIKLPEDDLKVDNEASFFIPKNEDIHVSFVGEPDRYLKKALELIEGMEISYSGSDIGDSDVYIISEDIQGSRADKLREDVSNGAVAVLMPDNDAISGVFSYEGYGKTLNKTVEIKEPLKVSLGKTKVRDTNISGAESLTGSSKAIQRIKYEKGNVLIYNLVGDDFSQNLLYPVFWKKILREMVNRPEISELNRKTGDSIKVSEIRSPSGERLQGDVKLDETGFYKSDSRTYAANLESIDESKVESQSYSVNEDEVSRTSQKSRQDLIVVLIMVLIGADIAYLRYRGDL